MLYKRGGQDRSLWNAIFQPWQPALFATNVGKFKTPVLSHLHYYSYRAFVRQESEQFTNEATEPYSVISRCQINKHGTGLFLCFKTVVALPQSLLSFVGLFVLNIWQH